jgi:pimeloyl-ACP methyl ester carboxylesterase
MERLDSQDVVLVGNSVGGGIAAEMALRLSPKLASTVLINSVRIDAGKPYCRSSTPPLCRRRSVPPLHSTISKIRLRSVDAGNGACDGGQSEGTASLFRRTFHARADAALVLAKTSIRTQRL